MIMLKAYKYRLYPNNKQINMIERTFGCARKVWNLMLADKIAYYNETGKSLTVTPAKYKRMAEYAYLKEVDSLALANVQLDLQDAYKSFFDRIKKGKKAGFPKFKSKKAGRKSYSTNNQRGSVRIENSKIRLPKIGFVKLVYHRPIMENSKIKTVTVSKTPSGKYFISVLTEYENQILESIPKTFAGLDFAMHGLFVDSDRRSAEYPNFFRQNEKKLARLYHRFSRTDKNSHNHAKMRLKISRLHEKIANQRNDFLHKTAKDLADRFDCIAVEDISVKAMAKRKKKGRFSFGKSVSDNGWSKFVEMLRYKLAWQGKIFIKVDKWFPSSQLCHNCGFQTDITKDLSVRKWTCPKCGMAHDRDYNAAVNIREEGKRIALAKTQ